MKSYEEILGEVTNHTYVSESGPILEFIRQLSGEGRLSEVSTFVQAYVEKVPTSKIFIISSLPAIILNSYICNQTQVTYEDFVKWSESDNSWAEEVKKSALDSEEFVTVISNILTRIR